MEPGTVKVTKSGNSRALPVPSDSAREVCPRVSAAAARTTAAAAAPPPPATLDLVTPGHHHDARSPSCLWRIVSCTAV